ncbi:MAG: DNA-binding domain-containing protein [Variovorax sp.]
MELAQFQSAFAAALFERQADAVGPLAELTAQPAFAVYRNTVMKGCLDTLEANFPSVARLVGSEWFRAAAAEYVCAEPPADGRMLRFGDSFADFLTQFQPAQEYSYLPDVARLDRYWTESHSASDAEPTTGNDLIGLAPEALAELVLAPHPAARWRWFEAEPIYTIWSRNRPVSTAGSSTGERRTEHDESGEADVAWHAEGALLTRASAQVVWCPAGRAECAFLDACANGLTLGQAASAAFDADPQVDVAALLARLLGAGALSLRGADALSARGARATVRAAGMKCIDEDQPTPLAHSPATLIA